jgi:hypothetical protein
MLKGSDDGVNTRDYLSVGLCPSDILRDTFPKLELFQSSREATRSSYSVGSARKS